MKNFQQTPRQRRLNMTRDKQALRASKPIKVFEQRLYYPDYSWQGYRVHNLVHHIDGRL